MFRILSFGTCKTYLFSTVFGLTVPVLGCAIRPIDVIKSNIARGSNTNIIPNITHRIAL